ncbi:MAG: hypothetical protein CL868_12455 [Cytophagaceae bacterium]|nr:hypothetical protein [Cytophagaceae bacterium]|tara:strand:- start:17682 stop:18434 length:753 start_codon:yes stop_codon:yes gene_type:complete
MSYKLTLTKSDIQVKQQLFQQKSLGIKSLPGYEPYFHRSADAGQNLFILTGEDKSEIKPATWTLLPTKKPKETGEKERHVEYELSNIDAEKVFTDPLYKENIEKKRCLILADGFFEPFWTHGEALPIYVYQYNHELFCMAGTYEKIADDIYTCSLITTRPNVVFDNQLFLKKKYQLSRIPLILDALYYDDWLNDATDIKAISQILKWGFARKEIKVHAVGHKICGSKTYNKPDAIKPIPHAEVKTSRELF